MMRPGRVALACLVGAVLVLAAMLLGGCSVPTGPDSGDPREAHVIAETARFAGMLRVSVRGVVTDEVYLVPATKPLFPGEKVPAAGWYKDGTAYYWRSFLLRHDESFGSRLAAHETCHALHRDEPGADACAAGLLR